MHFSNEGKKQKESYQIPTIRKDLETPAPKEATKPPVPIPTERLLHQQADEQHPRTQSVAVVVTKDGRTYSTSSYGTVGM